MSPPSAPRLRRRPRRCHLDWHHAHGRARDRDRARSRASLDAAVVDDLHYQRAERSALIHLHLHKHLCKIQSRTRVQQQLLRACIQGSSAEDEQLLVASAAGPNRVVLSARMAHSVTRHRLAVSADCELLGESVTRRWPWNAASLGFDVAPKTLPVLTLVPGMRCSCGLKRNMRSIACVALGGARARSPLRCPDAATRRGRRGAPRLRMTLR